MTIPYNCGIIRNFDDVYTGFMNALLSDPGYHRLEDSYHPDIYRMAALTKIEKPGLHQLNRDGAFTLSFDCRPQSFLKIGETPIEFTADGTVWNPTPFASRPLLRIWGTGSCWIGEEQITILTIHLCRHDDTDDLQPFEIYQITRPMNGRVTVLAHHISYRTEAITVTPFEADSLSAALTGLASHSVGDNPFTLWSDRNTPGAFEVTRPRTLRSLLAGEEGSLLDSFGEGEFLWDRFTIRLYRSRGQDRNVVLRYGRELTDLKRTSDSSGYWTGVVPYWQGMDPEGDDNQECLVMLPETVLYAGDEEPALKRIVPLDLSESFDDPPTVEQLRSRAATYVNANSPDFLTEMIDVSFVTEDPKSSDLYLLQRLSLCDTVRVIHTALGVESRAKVIRTIFDVVQERYQSMTLWAIRPDLATTISSGLREAIDDLRKTMATRAGLVAELADLQTALEQAVSEAADRITGESGGYDVVLETSKDRLIKKPASWSLISS